MTVSAFELARPVAIALEAGRPMVAIESTVVAHGLPWPDNLETVNAMQAAIRHAGAEPAVVGLVKGRLTIGLSNQEVERFAQAGRSVPKASRRDLPMLAAAGGDGATTIAATAFAAQRAGITIMATGGIGGVHRAVGSGNGFDVSADLFELARTSLAVVCSGAKSILDLPRTLELLESLGVAVIGVGTNEFPAFYAKSSGLPLEFRVDQAGQAADILRAHRAMGVDSTLVFSRPVPSAAAIDSAQLDSWLATALNAAAEGGIAGKAVTPFLLARLHEASGGKTLRANAALLIANARFAAEVAVAVNPVAENPGSLKT